MESARRVLPSKGAASAGRGYRRVFTCVSFLMLSRFVQYLRSLTAFHLRTELSDVDALRVHRRVNASASTVSTILLRSTAVPPFAHRHKYRGSGAPASTIAGHAARLRVGKVGLWGNFVRWRAKRDGSPLPHRRDRIVKRVRYVVLWSSAFHTVGKVVQTTRKTDIRERRQLAGPGCRPSFTGPV